MKRAVIFFILLVITLIGYFYIKIEKVTTLGFLEKGEKVEISFLSGLITKSFSYDNLNVKEDENVKYFYSENKIPLIFSEHSFTLKFFKNDKNIFDSTYVYEKENPTYLIGVMLPKLYDEMVRKKDPINDYKFYFRTPKDDKDFEEYLDKEYEEKIKRKKDSTEQFLFKKQTKK